MSSPLLMHLAGSDEYMPAEEQALIRATLGGNANVEIHTYPGRSHAFARNGSNHFESEAAELANKRTEAFFRRLLF